MPDHAGHGTLSDETTDIGHLLELADTSRPAWHRDAACREHPELTWFPAKGQHTTPAKQVCADCLARADCLAWALDQIDPPAGVWGGLSVPERTLLSKTTSSIR